MGGQQSRDPASSSDEAEHDGDLTKAGSSPNRASGPHKDEFGTSPSGAPSSLTERVQKMVKQPEKEASVKKAPQAEVKAPPIETVPTAFKWSGGGDRVFVTGSFNNWQGKIMMHKNEDNPQEFVLVIDIAPGVHHYKFIVDDDWRINPDLPTVGTGQDKNNVVEVKRPVFEHLASPFEDSDDEDVDENGKKLAYGQVIPGSEAYAAVPAKAPPQLSQRNVILNKECDNKGDPYLLQTPGHELLNHMCIQGNGSENSPVVITSITQRFRTKASISITPKFVTLIYYKPAPPSASLPSSGSSATAKTT